MSIAGDLAIKALNLIETQRTAYHLLNNPPSTAGQALKFNLALTLGGEIIFGFAQLVRHQMKMAELINKNSRINLIV
jgi:hypothetical protein